ncbi:hypothetical protein RSOLAG1IB_09301 [Rhizoctonia solani AG-1 IB]|uniref:Uncharacterized protein n=1 Tax=Thanatephorus cucumeris (strain AG1-IB / isolate 7/3/14) TaxID=1108050 RepID=A0A0B7FUY5_THACB|nr:hypothetical protein RSOLAG1IB_09301 [Rhizoctonia solani AG-1 IB]
MQYLLKYQSPGTAYVILTHVFTNVWMYAYKCVLCRISCTSVHYHTVELSHKTSSSTCLSTISSSSEEFRIVSWTSCRDQNIVTATEPMATTYRHIKWPITDIRRYPLSIPVLATLD